MRYLPFMLLFTFLISCDIKKSDIGPNTNFIRIYADNNSSHTYYPMDFVETEDQGFLIVSGLYTAEGLSYPKTHLLKTDKEGNMEWVYADDNTALSPTPRIIEIEGAYYMVCMQNNLQSKLMRIKGRIGFSAN